MLNQLGASRPTRLVSQLVQGMAKPVGGDVQRHTPRLGRGTGAERGAGQVFDGCAVHRSGVEAEQEVFGQVTELQSA
jgi:hypothetical protein